MRRTVALTAVLTIASAVSSWSPASAHGTPTTGYHPHTLLVAFDPSIPDAARVATHMPFGAKVVNSFEWMDLDVVWLPNGLDPKVAELRYEALPGVAYASVNREVHALGTPNDALFGSQWGFHNTGQTVPGSLVRGVADADIDAPEAWTSAFGATTFDNAGGTRVAVLDTGIDRGHVEFILPGSQVSKVKACANATSAIGVVVNGSCEDDGAHGTHTAGTVAANTGNTAGVAGTAPNAELAIFKFLNAGGVGFLADEIAAIRWAYTTGQAKVLSMSFGAYDPDNGEQQALRDAQAAGALLVAASGNDYDDTKNYPAYYPEVMSVGATNAAGQFSDFGNCNSDVEIAAPGEDVWSTTPGNSYAVLSGTSMATPHVAGAAALLMSEKGASASQVRNQLVQTGTSVGNGGRSACTGIRQVNLAAALGASGDPVPPPSPGSITGVVKEQKTAAAISAATVSCGSAGSATTGASGSYTISNVTPATYSCTASKSGYVSSTQNVSVPSGGTATANFTLRKQR
jgi:thermitase